ncbi:MULTISPECIES: helix-turn-helix transcriptional regulator [Paenibacillus]|uniref:helix-turn-helix transcriptional regulator n=1 Tax=Paenibacillus TaxID=44249 RepID=UPI0022B887CF|nr:YafY family protein [Paenibacillus caseinilyticus]MCZ8522757.1 YafY family protein [Paenibacillus caseinilyticus]
MIELMMAVNRKRKFTVKELAEEFGVSTRTMLRYLQELSGLGVPLYSQVGAGGGYHVLKERTLPPISFTENEAFSSDDVKSQIDEMRHRVDFFTHTRQERAAHLEILLQASIRRLPVTIQYGIGTDETKQRTIQPIGIYAHEGYWFCPAYCDLRKGFRLFRVDRIWSAAWADAEAISPSVDVSEVNLTNWGLHFYGKQECVDVKVKLTERGIKLFRDKSWIFPWGEVRVADDGTGILEAGISISELPFFSEYFYSFGAEAVVLQPEELREAVRRRLVHTLEKYNVPNS